MSKFSEILMETISKTTKLWGFEFKDSEGEWVYNPIRFDKQTHELSWGEISVTVDEDCENIDFALEGLFDACMEAGYTNG